MTVQILRSRQRLGVTIAALLFGPIFMGGPLIGGIATLIFAPLQIGIPFAIGLTAASLFLAYHMLQSYHWIELDGDWIRGRKFWTRQLVEQRIIDIPEVLPLEAIVKHAVENVLIDQVLGTRAFVNFVVPSLISLSWFFVSSVSSVVTMIACVVICGLRNPSE